MKTMIETRPANKADVGRIAKANGLCISIYLPTGISGRERLETPIRLRNAVDKAQRLLEAGGMRGAEATRTLDALRDLDIAQGNWITDSPGLALFVQPDQVIAHTVPFEVPELTILGSRMHVRPMLPILHGEGCFVLAIHEKEARLLHVKGEQCYEQAVPDMPRNLDEALGPEYYIKERQMHSVGPAGRFGSVSHGTGDRASDHKDRDLRYCQAVDRALVSFFKSGQPPLILAASEPILSIYRGATHHGHLLPEAIEGCPARTADQDLGCAASEIIGKHQQEHVNRLLELFADAEAQGRGMRRIDDIIPAAAGGRVAELFLDKEAFIWGTIDEGGGIIAIPEQEPWSEDLFNRAAIDTIANGGTVYELSAEPMLHTGAAATLRF